jgi:tricorn protease
MKAAREGDGDEQGAGPMYVVPAAAKPPEADELAGLQVRVDDWRLPVVPAEEWRQIFVDAWRMHRDFSFDPAMRSVDWEAVRRRYEPLVARVTDRYELDDLLGQMAGELGILHSQVRGADLPEDDESAAPAFLGAALARDGDGVAISRIWRSDPELPSQRSPLARPGVDAAPGDRIVAINGGAVHDLAEVAAELDNQAGQQVLLELRRGGANHRTIVEPVAARREAELRYGDWVEGRRERVAAAAEGRIGYLHLRAMGSRDIATFAREFYANYDREGLILDVRRNRGGNVDSWILEKLLRRAWAFWATEVSRPLTNMQQTFRGHLAVLVDDLTYSDGETFSAGIQALGLGPLVGPRTAGAGVWLSDRNRLSDRGVVRIGEYGQFGADGRWLIEGRGVVPDLKVVNPPRATYDGEDRQLQAAIELLLQRLAEDPVPPLRPGPITPRGGGD